MAIIEAEQFYGYENDAVGVRTLIATASDGSASLSSTNAVLYWDLNGNPVPIFTPSTNAQDVRMVASRDYAYFADGNTADLYKWNYATSLTKAGITLPVSAPSLSSPSAGNITLLIGRRYLVVYGNTTDQSYSDASPPTATTGVLTNQEQPLTSIPVSSDTQVNTKILLATADGGDLTTLYEVTTLAANATTYTDNMPEATLLEQNVWQYTDSSGIAHGVYDNTPPPNAFYPILNNGRIFMADGVNVYFSKNLAEVLTSTGIIAGRFEECFPVSNVLSLSTEAEQVHGLLTDGTALYIGTEKHIWRVTGDSPSNFSQPQVCFNQCGLATQNVWQVVYLEGTPVGTMWLTPDLRVMSSDFNTYQNVGTPIQSTLNSINTNAINACWGIYAENGPYNFYILAIPTGTNNVPDTLCIYDMHVRRWYIWTCADQFAAGIYYVNLAGIARWIVSDQSGNIRYFDPSFVTDRQTDPTNGAIGIQSTMRTSWLAMGDPAIRKVLNELELQTSVPNMAITVEGATKPSLFSTPNSLVAGANPITSPFGDQKVYLAGYAALDRFYRITMISTSSLGTSQPSDTFLGYYSVEVLPLHKF